jgi:hypothetical protein
MKHLITFLFVCFLALEVGFCAEGGRGGGRGGGFGGGGGGRPGGVPEGVPGGGRSAGGLGGENTGRRRDRAPLQDNQPNTGNNQQGQGTNQTNTGNKDVGKTVPEQRVERNDMREIPNQAEQKNQNEVGAASKGNVEAIRTERKDRIQFDIAKGCLTDSELAKLEERQKDVSELESSYRLDGKLTKEEYVALRKTMNASGACLWAETILADGLRRQTHRFGRNIFAQNAFSAKLQEEADCTRAEARAALKDFREAMRLKRVLAADELSAEQRTQVQNDFNDLLNKYFEVR